MHYDPLEHRRLLLGGYGYERSLARSFEDARIDRSLSGISQHDLAMAIECYLVGFDEPAHRLAEQARTWVQAAIDTNEHMRDYCEGWSEAEQLETLAMCNWFLQAPPDAESLDRCLKHHDHYLKCSGSGRDRVSVSLTLPTYVDYGAYRRAIEIFMATPGYKPPAVPGRLYSEAAACHVIAEQRLSNGRLSDDGRDTIAKFLRRFVGQWLKDGQWRRAARWMKIVHWNEAPSALSPKQVVMKCYDYLRGVQPPPSSTCPGSLDSIQG